MRASSRTRLLLPLVSLLATFALAAQAQEHEGPGGHQQPQGRPQAPMGRPGPGPGGGHPQGPGPAMGPSGMGHAPGPGPMAGHPQGHPQGGPMGGHGPDGRFARGAIMARDFGGHQYRGRIGWEGGRWRHEVHDGRDGWWWDVGGVWYYYPQPMDGPPAYVSEDYADDVVYAPEGAYAPPVAYESAPPPPPPVDPGASAVGGAIVGGVLGGLLTGRASGAAAGAVVGGATGAIAGATAAARPGYYLAQGNCYYRYPSGQYVAADPRACY